MSTPEDTALGLLLQRPIAYHRVFVELGAGVTGAVMLSQALYWQPRAPRRDGWWWKTQDEWADETGMSRRELETARKKLVAAGVLQYARRGVPARGWYRVVEADVAGALSRLADSANLEKSKEKKPEKPEQSRLAESANLDWPDAPNQGGGIRQSSTETTAETTRSSSSDESHPSATTTAASAAKGAERTRGPGRTLHGFAVWDDRDDTDIRDAVERHGAEAVELQAAEQLRTGAGTDKYGQPLISHARAALGAEARAAESKPHIVHTPSPEKPAEPTWKTRYQWAEEQIQLAAVGWDIDVEEMHRVQAEALAARDLASAPR